MHDNANNKLKRLSVLTRHPHLSRLLLVLMMLVVVVDDDDDSEKILMAMKKKTMPFCVGVAVVRSLGGSGRVVSGQA